MCSDFGLAKDVHPAQAIHLKVSGTKIRANVKNGGDKSIHGVLL